MQEVIVAETVLYSVDKDGRQFDIGVMIGQPYEHELGDWACPVALVGLHGRFPDIHGIDSFQSLTLALRLIGNLLTVFVEDGGKLYREKGGDEMSVGELFGDVTETPEPEWPPTEEQQSRINKLTADDLQKIDEAILAHASSQWRKVARIVGSAIDSNSGIVPSIPDIFYAERVRKLVAAGKLESQGNLAFMRFSEVRLPS
ncbi:MAG TPA: DUF3658 domain-containing protein [Pyrinomonadaceae bacterium]|nr:DUF3658 domain-containing protein [Pyrinomonadaceae bacterium]